MSGRVNTSRMFARHTLFRLTPRTALSLLQELAAKLGGDRGPYIQRRHRLSYLPNNTILDPPMWVNLFKSCSRPRNLTLCQPQVSVVAGPRNQTYQTYQPLKSLPRGRPFAFRARVNTVSTEPRRRVSTDGAQSRFLRATLMRLGAGRCSACVRGSILVMT